MTTDPTDAVYSDMWYFFMVLLGEGYPDRDQIAAVGAWSAVTCRNVSAIHRYTGRDRKWITKQLRVLEELVTDISPEAIAQMLLT